ncbi:hypothetical protein NDU88_003343 [Pleurodeles waltl]|uniref:Uncharacterized protein n=1 Tax=Pleurodeles waltl TaxID=8319 RepID=A0AAV7TPF8_PLEWA|nr:hypothetical protein NDU88_003343 [Pleurodeles waltl]
MQAASKRHLSISWLRLHGAWLGGYGGPAPLATYLRLQRNLVIRLRQGSDLLLRRVSNTAAVLVPALQLSVGRAAGVCQPQGSRRCSPETQYREGWGTPDTAAVRERGGAAVFSVASLSPVDDTEPGLADGEDYPWSGNRHDAGPS